MQCPNCKFENAERAKTCARCGTVLNRSELKPQPPARNKRSSCGIGACVIVAVLLIGLVVIAFPILNRQRVKARATSCLSNVKQLQLGMLMYAQDYDEVMPPAGDWCDLMYPYVKNKQIYVCPQTPGAVGSYAMNDALSGRAMSAMASPAATVCLFDSPVGWNMYGGPSLVVNRHKKRTKGLVDRIINGRKNGAYFAFADGHAKWVAPRAMSKYTWSVSAPPAASGTTGGP